MRKMIVVVDTNTFLHYVSLDQIAWNEVLPDTHVVLLISPPVIRELNKHKDSPRTPKLRDRAASALRKIDVWGDLPSPTVLRESVEVQFRVYDSQIDFPAQNLVRDIADDHLIAALLDSEAETPETPTALLTKDTGLKLKARAHGFRVISLPDSALLPDEALPSEKKIRELESLVRELQNARPRLLLAFADGSNSTKLNFQRAGEVSDSEVADRIAEMKSNYPMMVEREENSKVSSADHPFRAILNAGASLSHIRSEAILEYNEALDRYYADYEEYLEQLSVFYAWERRTAALNILLVNDGTSPAEDIDIFMHFPDGFELIRGDQYAAEPKTPKQPRKPRSMLEEMTDTRFAFPEYLTSSLYANPDFSSRLAAPLNVGRPRIKRTNSYDVDVSLPKAKHGLNEALDVMYITFESLSTVRNFTIDYMIHAANLPQHITGSLHVTV
jgi:rRNA-processing protein FCF1